ncbi:MAG TPA: PTS fructose transporter subunit IIA [Sedimentibacter sp.]|jgi:PTS system mannose-specific IIA component|nr:PTS fructose transporter subunit IIA [Sedimentibacter sp.]HHZ00701.1 PTS fructose transporter subunit IIA [Tissierellia bacterium]HOK48724.1 PTS fructose transporter subunit IIA [Sedimentibacter sp.]HOW23313.1 PTS fructose transporter subunit IIA [Sedimentibacter sp.]HRC81138.1 PTS fructose transporter subunit IIA [Sedimentibacter sp.]
MINILLVTHGDLGKELLKSSELIIGKVENAESISFYQGESFETLLAKVERIIENLSDDELIVFTDMYGGSPYNAVNRAMKNRNFYHITGINFPLFIDIAISRDTYSLKEIAEKIIKNGKKSIVFVNEKFLTD